MEQTDPGPAETRGEEPLSSSLRALRRILQEHLEIEIEEEEDEDERDRARERTPMSPHSLLDTDALSMFFRRQEVPEGAIVFDVGQKADSVYFIERGSVEIVLAAAHGLSSERVNKISDGGIFGEAAFFLDLPSRSVPYFHRLIHLVRVDGDMAIVSKSQNNPFHPAVNESISRSVALDTLRIASPIFPLICNMSVYVPLQCAVCITQ